MSCSYGVVAVGEVVFVDERLIARARVQAHLGVRTVLAAHLDMRGLVSDFGIRKRL